MGSEIYRQDFLSEGVNDWDEILFGRHRQQR